MHLHSTGSAGNACLRAEYFVGGGRAHHHSASSSGSLRRGGCFLQPSDGGAQGVVAGTLAAGRAAKPVARKWAGADPSSTLATNGAYDGALIISVTGCRQCSSSAAAAGSDSSAGGAVTRRRGCGRRAVAYGALASARLARQVEPCAFPAHHPSNESRVMVGAGHYGSTDSSVAQASTRAARLKKNRR